MGSECVCPCAVKTQLEVKQLEVCNATGEKNQTVNGSVILNLATEHTQLTTYLEIGRRGGGGGGGEGRTRGDEGAG